MGSFLSLHRGYGGHSEVARRFHFFDLIVCGVTLLCGHFPLFLKSQCLIDDSVAVLFQFDLENLLKLLFEKKNHQHYVAFKKIYVAFKKRNYVAKKKLNHKLQFETNYINI